MRLPQHMANKLHAAQTSDSPYAGGLKISLTSSLGPLPIKGASVTISLTGDPDSVVETLTTDESGQTDTVELPAPPGRLQPDAYRPAALFRIQHIR